MTAPDTALHGLKRQRPEWEPWLAVVEEILREATTPTWDVAVSALGAEAPGAKAAGSGIEAPAAKAAARLAEAPRATAAAQTAAPLLAGMTIPLAASSVRRLLERLIRTASMSGPPKMATLGAVLRKKLDVLALFTASLRQDYERVKEIAASGADAEALQAVIALLPVPFLQACNRRWASSISESWETRYCPVCGSWPAFAEVRGIERRRYFRCGRCGGAWHARALSCPYCALGDHDELVNLLPEKSGSHAVIEACKRCRGYVKTFPTLRGCPPATVMLEDLASVDLDVAALDHGYRRPTGQGYSLDVTVIEKGATRRFLWWKT
jgi:FdhE protein